MKNLFLHPGWRRVIFFFPFQLVFLHIKKNLLLLSIWGLLFGIVTQSLAPRYGVPYLFLNPEYLDKVSILSYFIVGFACGGFTMAFNIASYILNSFRFPFLATLSHPFTKYCINNYIIPGVFLFVYIWNIISFLLAEQVYSNVDIFTYICGFLGGFISFVLFTLLYFFRTNKDIHRMFGVKLQEPVNEAQLVQRLRRRIGSWKNPYLIKESRDWYVETYLSGLFKVRLVRAVRHYKREMLKQVFKQNHRNAGIFSFISIITLLALGLFREEPYLMIPASASVFLLLTMLIMLPVPLYSIFKGWAPVILIFFLVALNSLYQTKWFNNVNKVYGLNYDAPKAPYDNKRLNEFASEKDTADADFKKMVEVLNKWRLKNFKTSQNSEKPKFVIVCTSGGGLRSSLWTFHSLQYADSLLEGELMKHIALITGSSGGMIGAAYLRERYWQSQSGKANLYDKSYLADVSKDVLNSVSFSVATNDWFLSLQSVRYGNYLYNKDRGYIFEKRMDDNLGNVFGERRLCDFRLIESESIVPMMIFSPTIVNDGRKLIVSSLPVSFLTQSAKTENLHVNPLNDGIEFSRFFRKQSADSILFTSILRMSSTFPYITPIVSLPSDPAIEIMDAGMRDNYGIEVALKYLYVFKNWLETNTSGVVIIQIRDRHKEFLIEENPPPTIMNALSRPLGSFYGNLFYMQDFTQSQEIEFVSSWYKGSIDIIDFNLKNEIPDKISLSWHLTNREKQKVLNSIYLPENREAIDKLRRLLQ